jgi:S-formylglutathione hydrolase
MLPNWSRLLIAGKPADVYDPPGSAGSRFGLLFLHGIGQETLSSDAVYTQLFERYRLACVSPITGRCWWADRICGEFDPVLTPEKHLLENVLPFFQQRWGLAPRSIGLLGISMGGQGALRLAFKYPQLFPAATGIASAIDYHELYCQGSALDFMYDSKEQCRQDTATLHVPPFNPPPHLFFCIDPDDPLHRGNDRLHEKLGALGVGHTCDLTTRAGGHSWEYFDHMAEPAVRFLVDGLEHESRRLL